MYNCDKCSKTFETKYLLKRHSLNKLPCDTPKKILSIQNNKSNDLEQKIENIDKNIEEINNKISLFDEDINKLNDKMLSYELKSDNKTNKCWFCKKDFATKQSTKRHFNESCTNKNKIIEEKNKLNEEKNKLNEEKNKIIEEKKNINIQTELKELRETVAKLIKKQSTQNINITNNITNNNTNNTNNTNNNTNNLMINLNSFGKENLSHISLNDYKKYLGGFFPGFIKFIEKIHFDDSAPENHNINITNLKSKYLHIYEDNQWTTKEKKDVLDKFISKKYNTLVDKCEELEEKNEIDEKIIEDFMRFTQNYKNDEAQQNTQKKILLMMYNNKDKIDMK